MTKKKTTKPTKKKKGKKPRKVSNAAQTELRLNKIEEWISECKSRTSILRLSANKWGVKSRTVDEYLKKVKDRIVKEHETDREKNAATLKKMFMKGAEVALKRGKLSEFVSALNGAAKIDGVFSETLRLNHKGMGDLSDDDIKEIKSEIAEEIKKKKGDKKK